MIPSSAHHVHNVILDVLYADTDAMGIVYYANYLRFFEAGRLGYIQAFALDHEQWVPEGVRLPVTEVSCRYRRPAIVFDKIRVETTLTQVNRASFHFGYKIYRIKDGALLVDGETGHAYTDAAGKVRRFDDRMKQFFERSRNPSLET